MIYALFERFLSFSRLASQAELEDDDEHVNRAVFLNQQQQYFRADYFTVVD